MATKTVKTRMKQKRDAAANWESKNPVLLDGEIIIVDTANGETRTKTGDGVKTYTQLPFDDEGTKGGKSLISKTIVDKLFYDNETNSLRFDDSGMQYDISAPGAINLKSGELTVNHVASSIAGYATLDGARGLTVYCDTASADVKIVDSNNKVKHKLSEKQNAIEGKTLVDEKFSNLLSVSETISGESSYSDITLGTTNPHNTTDLEIMLNGITGERVVFHGSAGASAHSAKMLLESGDSMISMDGESGIRIEGDRDGNAPDVITSHRGITHKLSEKAEKKLYTVSIPTTSWESTTSGNTTIYSKTITVSGITSDDTPVVDIIPSSTPDTAKKELEAFGCVSRITTGTNSITVYCYDSHPETAFTIQLLNIK